MRPCVNAVALAAVLLAAAHSHAQTPAACRLDEAQRLMGQSPAPHARIDALLADCARADPAAWNVVWLQGVNARNQQRLDEALALLRRAHAMAPDEAAPALDLAVVHEWRGEPALAAALYARVLAREPASRPALLGSARTARALGRTREARARYETVLRQHPGDAAALAGLGYVDLDEMRLDAARDRFGSVLGTDPADADAREGLRRLDGTWRYQFDFAVGKRDLAAGDATTVNAGLRLALDARSDLELGLLRNTRELPSASLVDPTPLPSWAARVGYRSRTSSGLTWSTAYEYRERRADPGEHRVEIAGGGKLQGPVGWSAGHREGFGASAVRNRLTHAGLSLDVARHWSVGGTLYAGDSRRGGSSNAVVFNVWRDAGPMAVMFNAGVGYSPDPDNTSVHARVIVPLAPQHALVLSAERRSLGSEVEASVGWRHFWR